MQLQISDVACRKDSFQIGCGEIFEGDRAIGRLFSPKRPLLMSSKDEVSTLVCLRCIDFFSKGKEKRKKLDLLRPGIIIAKRTITHAFREIERLE
jgi:hypothetical protein